MRLQVIAVGRLKLDYARLGCAEYATRLGRHFPLDIQEVRDAHRSKGGDAARFRADEARSLLERLRKLVEIDITLRVAIDVVDVNAHPLAARRKRSEHRIVLAYGGYCAVARSQDAMNRKIQCVCTIGAPYDAVRIFDAQQVRRIATGRQDDSCREFRVTIRSASRSSSNLSLIPIDGLVDGVGFWPTCRSVVEIDSFHSLSLP